MRFVKLFDNFTTNCSTFKTYDKRIDDVFDAYVFESLENKPDRKPRPEKKDKQIKRCIGMCDRKFFIKDGEPVIYCPSCDRILK